MSSFFDAIMQQIRRQSTAELEKFKERWDQAVREDKEWFDPFEGYTRIKGWHEETLSRKLSISRREFPLLFCPIDDLLYGGLMVNSLTPLDLFVSSHLSQVHSWLFAKQEDSHKRYPTVCFGELGCTFHIGLLMLWKVNTKAKSLRRQE